MQEKTKLPGDRVEMTECMFCHSGLSALVRQQHAISSKPAFNQGGRGRNRKHSKKSKAKQPKDKMSQLAAYFV